jgi:ATP-dependent Clp protease ATP-binding subunit ClpA
MAQLAAEAADAATPMAALRALRELRRELDVFERQEVAQALAEGATFAGIAREIGLSRQAVHRRFRELTDDAASVLTTDDLRRVLLYARNEATALGAESPGGEHIVLGTLNASEIPAAGLLRAAGATLERARAQVAAAATRAPLFRREPAPGDLRTMLELPARQAREQGRRRVDVPDVLLAVLADDAGGAARLLRALGVDVGLVRREMRAPGLRRRS